MTNTQLYTIVALCIYAIAMALIGCISYGKSKTLDGFLIGGRNIGAWATAFAYGTTYFSAVVFVGYAGQHGWNIGIGIALAFTYILFMRFSQMFVHTDTLSPAVALWLPNIVFAVIAIFLYRIAPK